MDDGVSNKLNRKRQRAMCKESRVRARLLATAVRHGLRIGSAAVMLLLPSVLLAQGPFGPDVELSELDGSNGFVINGVVTADYSGRSVSNAGDINGDGIDDLIIGAPGASPNGKHSAGESYVVFGGNGELGLADLDGSNGLCSTVCGLMTNINTQ